MYSTVQTTQTKIQNLLGREHTHMTDEKKSVYSKNINKISVRILDRGTVKPNVTDVGLHDFCRDLSNRIVSVYILFIKLTRTSDSVDLRLDTMLTV